MRWIEDAGYSAKNLRRPGIEEALTALPESQADALVVSRLDRLRRSLLDFAGLMETAGQEGWALVALDLGVDRTTPSGEMMAHVMASFAQFERKLIGQRTRESLAQRRAAGVRLGRPRQTPDAVIERIGAEREQGRSLRAIADGRNAEGAPTVRGGLLWRPSAVQAAQRSADRSAAANRLAFEPMARAHESQPLTARNGVPQNPGETAARTPSAPSYAAPRLADVLRTGLDLGTGSGPLLGGQVTIRKSRPQFQNAVPPPGGSGDPGIQAILMGF